MGSAGAQWRQSQRLIEHKAIAGLIVSECGQYFWIGDWDTFEADAPNGPSIARARVEPIAQGCAIHELYEQSDGSLATAS